MKLRHLIPPLALAAMLIAALRLFPGFAEMWADAISRPAIAALHSVSSRFPFALLEWCAVFLALSMLFSLILRWPRRGFFRALTGLLRQILTMGAAFILLLCALWLPLYSEPSEYAVAGEQLAASCAELIDRLNASDPDFSRVPDDLPAKIISLPAWMDALEISGICSFMTGEALISPELPPVSMPFVAMHERMHLEGRAGEGAANIAAWEACMNRGGVYADSARIWALRYSMGLLRRMDPALHDFHLSRMNPRTLQLYRQAGGAYAPAPLPRALRALYRLLGVEASAQDYEILALHLAAQLPR